MSSEKCDLNQHIDKMKRLGRQHPTKKENCNKIAPFFHLYSQPTKTQDIQTQNKRLSPAKPKKYNT